MENIQHGYRRIEIRTLCNFNCLQEMRFTELRMGEKKAWGQNLRCVAVLNLQQVLVAVCLGGVSPSLWVMQCTLRSHRWHIIPE